MTGPPSGGERRVLPLELFFDLVFVFAFTQVTAAMAAEPTWERVGEGMLVLAAVWWAWGAYSWLTNTIEADATVARLTMFAAMAAMLVAALAIPQAFGREALVFAIAYFIVRVLHIALFAAASAELQIRAAVRTLATTAIPAPALLFAAALVDDQSLQVAIWVVALAVDYLGPYVRGVEGFLVSPGHFAERFGLILIIAFGESIVAIGVGSGATIELRGAEIASAALAVLTVAALWWTYFDSAATRAERRLREAADGDRARLARDAYSYLHLPMVAGIVLLALGIKKTLEYGGDPLADVPAVALCGGVALYLAASAAFRRRVFGSTEAALILAAAAAAALIPVATEAGAIAALAGLVAVVAALVTHETTRRRPSHSRLRRGGRRAARA